MPGWVLVAFSVMATLQIVTILMMFFGGNWLYGYISNVDRRLNEAVEKSRSEIIQLFKRE